MGATGAVSALRGSELPYGGLAQHHFLGSHEGAYTPFWFDATTAARIGAENELVVRVAGLSRKTDVDGQPLQQAPASKQSWYYIESGLWGDVAVEAVPLLSCHDVVIQPDLRREAVGVEIAIRNAHPGPRSVELSLGVRSPVRETSLRPARARHDSAGGYEIRLPA